MVFELDRAQMYPLFMFPTHSIVSRTDLALMSCVAPSLPDELTVIAFACELDHVGTDNDSRLLGNCDASDSRDLFLGRVTHCRKRNYHGNLDKCNRLLKAVNMPHSVKAAYKSSDWPSFSSQHYLVIITDFLPALSTKSEQTENGRHDRTRLDGHGRPEKPDT